MAKLPDRPTDCPPFMVLGKNQWGQIQWMNKSINELSWDETEEILNRISSQLKVIHELPKIDGNKPDVYMNEALWGLRRMCQDIHWRRIALVSKKIKPG
jgi:hypothetical protein